MSEEDLAIIAACLQDAIVAAGEMQFIPEERRFALVANRFRWEDERPEAAKLPERVLCGVIFEDIARAQARNLPRAEAGTFLELLSVLAAPGPTGGPERVITLTFAGGGGARLEAARINCRLEDLTEPWPTLWRPSHEPPAEGDSKA